MNNDELIFQERVVETENHSFLVQFRFLPFETDWRTVYIASSKERAIAWLTDNVHPLYGKGEQE